MTAATAGPSPLLSIVDARKRFGGLHALAGVSLDVHAGQIKGLIGPNGAGKTTLFQAICGFERLDGGTIHFRGQRIDRLPPYQVARRGLIRSFQLTQPFKSMSVLDNVMTGLYRETTAGMLASVLRLPSARSEEAASRAPPPEILELVGIPLKWWELADNLSLGQTKLLELARCLAANPTLLLLDEPAGGLHPTMVANLTMILHRLKGRGITTLLVEHNMPFVLSICDEVAVLDHGEKIFEGPPAAARRDPRVLEAYLGTRGAAIESHA